MIRRIFFWLSVGFLFLLFEGAFLFRLEAIIFVFTLLFGVAALARRREPLENRIVLSLIPLIGFFVLAWARSFFAQGAILVLLWSYIELYRKEKTAWREPALLALLFLLCANFFVFRGALPASYGISFFLTALTGFAIVSLHIHTAFPEREEKKFLSLLLSALLAEWLLVMQFLPQGYLSLALASLVFYLTALHWLRKRNATLLPKRIALELGASAALILLILLSGGIRPR